jgi:hypothetical protein
VSSTRKQRQRTTSNRDISAFVRQARALARELLVDGLDVALDDGTLYGRLEEHIGIRTPIRVIHDKEFLKVVAIGEGAFAIGIAVGLLLRPDAFTDVKGGAR